MMTEQCRPSQIVLALVLFVGPSSFSAPASAQQLLPSEPAFWAVSGAAFAGAWFFDDDLRRDHPDEWEPTLHVLAGVGFQLGRRQVVVPALATTLVVTRVTGWPTESRRMAHATAGVLSAALVTEAIKSGVGRGRPRNVGEPRRFQPFTRENEWMSLPSGHASAGFGVAAALAQEFDLGLAEPLAYGLAGLISWSRIYDDAHWVSDAVAGAVVGIAVARTTVAWLNRNEEDEQPRPSQLTSPRVPVVLLRIRLP